MDRIPPVTRKTAIFVTLALPATVLLLELLLQLGSLAVKEHSWRAQSQWLTGNLRILALGDSNTYGLYLPAEDSYPAQLEKLWNLQHPNQPIEVINLGYPGTNSFRLRANLPELLNTFQPDLVLMMIGFNDFWTPVEIPATVDELTWLEKLQYHSRLYQLFYMWFRQQQLSAVVDSGERILGGLANITFNPEEIVRIEKTCNTSISTLTADHLTANPALKKCLDSAHHEALKQRKEQAPPQDILNTVKYGSKIFSLGIAPGTSAGNSKQMPQNILAMSEMLQQRRIPYFLLNYPTRFGYYPAANKKIATLLAEHPQPFIDLQNVFHPSCQKQPEQCPELLFYDAHATAMGNQLIAESVMKTLELYLLNSAPR